MARKISPQAAQPTMADGSTAEAAAAAAVVSETSRLLGTSDADLAGFFAAFARYASPEDLLHYSATELAALIRLAYRHLTNRRAGETLVELIGTAEEPALKHGESVLVAINDDVPFLYDSCTAEIRALGQNVIAAFHPVIPFFAGEPSAKQSVIVLALGAAATEEPTARQLRDGLIGVFADVHAAVRDWKPMLARLAESREELIANPPRLPASELEENVAFLDWLADNHLTFLGCRDYSYSAEGEGKLVPIPASGLGVLSRPGRRVLRAGNESSELGAAAREFLNRPAPLIIAKSGLRSTVHRRVPMDYIGIKRIGTNGELAGERRFVGLFTSAAYRKLPGEIPLLRLKTAHVMAGSGLLPASHDGKALQHILDTFPRDELFQISEDELLATALGILNLGERPKIRLFLRFDRFDRYVSALVFIPRERYGSAIRESIHAILARALDGRMTAAMPMLDDEALARVHYIIGRNPGPRPQVDAKQLEAEIRKAVRTWEDDFNDAVSAQFGEGCGAIMRRYARAFPASYRDRFSPAEATADIGNFEDVLAGRGAAAGITAKVYARDTDGPDQLRLKLFVRGNFIALSECLPVFENLGLKVIAEAAFALTPVVEAGTAQIAIQDFLMVRPGACANAHLRALLEDAFHAVWAGRAESDGFNRLVLAAELPWRDVVFLRSVAKYLRQAGLNFSHAYVAAALEKNPALAALLVRLFCTAHDPGLFAAKAERETAVRQIRDSIDAGLKEVPSADEDRIVRSIMSVIDAMLRTNFFQSDASGKPLPHIAFKLRSARVPVLPAPKPLYEIYVYAPCVEAVHLRFGKIARGGIRWSDRAEDFRSEVLGLGKAQQVKNSVIVPVGAKGGFYPKRIPAGSPREIVQKAGVDAYRLFIGALLDLTDNIDPDGQIVPPAGVIRYDDDDPYLVVAADKGTANFSDVANEIALSRGYWLGDAFASGGSEGYDHKRMGITARGAWEGIRRHFREMKRDIQTEAFTCIGIGDMSGDVFGNGMLCSRQMKLIAAFDHRHIFFDPSPDPASSWTERQRLFRLPRSSWADYDLKLISAGGGVFPRSEKAIPVNQPLRSLTGIAADYTSPQELIRALLIAPIDLLFFGGIGTFIKSSKQSNTDVSDRDNDEIRINARDVSALVIGEGANLGVTQLGRVEYARDGGPDHQGGRINTDAIDNSAGVDTSDHEVNIKILMSGPLRSGEISRTERLQILTSMTDDVARQVLADNYDQTLALSVAELRAARDLDAAWRFMRDLERRDALDRGVENLPTDDDLRLLRRESRGLTRPENAVLLAYAKLDLFHSVSESGLPSDRYFDSWLAGYFPQLAAERFAGELNRHPLGHAIISTQIANRTINLAGPLFAHRMRELSNAPLWTSARAFILADGAFGLSGLKARVCALDLQVPARVQNETIAEIAELLRRLGLWFMVQLPNAPIGDTVAAYRAGFAALKGRFSTLISPVDKNIVEPRIAAMRQSGMPLDVAEETAILPLLSAVPEIIKLSQSQQIGIDTAARVFYGVGATAGLDRLRALASRILTADHWERLALRRMIDDLYSAQRQMACEALSQPDATGTDAIGHWRNLRQDDIDRTLAFLSEMEREGDATIARISLANSQIQKLATRGA